MKTIKELREAYNQCVAVSKELRDKYQGKAETMPGDEYERWEKAVDDAEGYIAQIKKQEKAEMVESWGKSLDSNSQEMVEDLRLNGSDGDQKQIEQFASFSTKASELYSKLKQTDEVQAMTKLMRFGMNRLEEKELKALSVGSTADGGAFVLPMALSNMMIDLVRDKLFLRDIAMVLPPMVKAESIGAIALDTDAEDTDWTSEVGTGTEEDTLKLGRRVLEPHALAKRVKVSKKLLRLSPEAVTFVMDRLAYRRARTEEYAFLLGNGSQRPLGAMVANAQGVSTSRDRSTASANVVAADDFWNTRDMLHDSYRQTATWVIHPSLETRIRKLKDSNNNYIWQPGMFNSQFLVGGMPQTICGHPYRTSYLLTDPSYTGNITTGTYVAILAAWKDLYWIVDALDMEIQVLTELYAESGQNGYILRSESDGMPVREEACARMKVS